VYSSRRGSTTSSIDSSPIEAYNSRIRFPTQANLQTGKEIQKEEKKCCLK